MIFELLGRFATRHRYLIIAIWVVAAAIVTLTAPRLEDVVSSDVVDFLPKDAPYQRAITLYERLFPHDTALGSSVIVFDARASAEGILNPDAPSFEARFDTEAGRFIRAFTEWATSAAAPDVVSVVTSPVQSPTLAAVLVAGEGSPDPALVNRVALVRVYMTETATEPPAIEAMRQIDEWLEAHRPPSVRAYQTGASPLVYETSESVMTSADRAIWVTIGLVIIMLLTVYRSPVSPLIPLSAVTIAYLITRGIVAWLGAHYLTITTYANVLLITIMYGAGTDYCLFLISRFREEMADHPGIEAATAHTVHRVGETITSSAGTIFVGFMAMIFAKMGIFNTTGPALALAVIITLLAGLTFVPALLATLGHRAFWPRQATHRPVGRWYGMTSQWVSTRPLMVILVIVALMLPLSVYGLTQHVTYDLLDDLPDDRPVVLGFKLLQDSLGAGNTMPLTVVVSGRDPDRLATDIVRLSDEIAALEGVFDVRGLDDPLGQRNGSLRDILHVSAQLRLIQSALDAPAAATTLTPAQLATALEGMRTYLDLLGERFPQVADDPNLILLRDLLANPLQLLTRQFRERARPLPVADNPARPGRHPARQRKRQQFRSGSGRTTGHDLSGRRRLRLQAGCRPGRLAQQRCCPRHRHRYPAHPQRLSRRRPGGRCQRRLGGQCRHPRHHEPGPAARHRIRVAGHFHRAAAHAAQRDRPALPDRHSGAIVHLHPGAD